MNISFYHGFWQTHLTPGIDCGPNSHGTGLGQSAVDSPEVRRWSRALGLAWTTKRRPGRPAVSDRLPRPTWGSEMLDVLWPLHCFDTVHRPLCLFVCLSVWFCVCCAKLMNDECSHRPRLFLSSLQDPFLFQTTRSSGRSASCVVSFRLHRYK